MKPEPRTGVELPGRPLLATSGSRARRPRSGSARTCSGARQVHAHGESDCRGLLTPGTWPATEGLLCATGTCRGLSVLWGLSGQNLGTGQADVWPHSGRLGTHALARTAHGACHGQGPSVAWAHAACGTQQQCPHHGNTYTAQVKGDAPPHIPPSPLASEGLGWGRRGARISHAHFS